MASSQPLRPQNRSLQSQTGTLKQQEMNKTKQSAVGSIRGSENLDPNVTETGKGINKLRGVSRLPVLAKSIHPVGIDPSQQNKWEQRPLTGKAQKKKICTKPVPFNLSQSRKHGQRNTDGAGGKAPLTPARLTPGAKLKSNKATTPGVLKSANKSQSAVPRTAVHMELASTEASLDSASGHPVSHESISCSQTDLSSRLGSITLAQLTLPEDSGLSHLCRDALFNVGVGSFGQEAKDKNCIQIVQSASGTQNTGTKAIHNVLSREESSTVGAQNMMPRLSTCPSGPGSSNNLPLRVCVKKSQPDIVITAGNAGMFSPDPLALRSILQNDAMNVVERDGVTPRTSTCPTRRPTSIYSAQRVPVRKPRTDEAAVTGNSGSFSPDQSALRSILQNEGVRAGALGGTTPRVSTCPTGRPTSIYSAQRVPVRKPRTDEVAVTGSAGSFSPDPSALRSILQNEGVRAGALSGATPRVSTCLTGRGTSIYSAQRVPVKKTKTEATGTASYCANRTPVKTWTPQRVPNTKPQSMRKLLMAQSMSRFRDSPGFSGPQDPGTEILMHQEEDVVQRLFDDPEQLDSDQTDKTYQLQTTSITHQTIELLINKDISGSHNSHTEEKEKKTAEPFIQAAHRSSVIVYSSSQKLCGSDRPQETPMMENSITSHNMLQSKCNGSQVTISSDMTKQINICTQSQLKASTQRRRHTPLEEMILDEECFTYTSRLLSCPLQPRCGNPVATTLLFQDSTSFLPICLSSPVCLSPVPSGSSIRA